MYRSLILLSILLIISTVFAQEEPAEPEPFPTVNGPFLGQTPPGDIPKYFGPGLIPKEGVQHCYPTVSADGKEIYWMEINREERRGIILCMIEENGQWTPPHVAPFSGEHNDHTPVFSPDGNRLYFVSSRPGGFGGYDIWYLEMTDTGWSEPVNLGSPPNTEGHDRQPSFTSDGTLYFVGQMDSVVWNRGIYRSRIVDGKYSAREALPESINSKDADIYPFIAHDESYLIWGSGRPGLNDVETELWISFRDENDNWSEPVNLGERVNNNYTVTFPWVSLDNKYLFFNRFDESGTDAFYWTNAAFLDSLKPKN